MWTASHTPEGNKAGEQRDVGVGDVVAGDAAIAAVADVPGAEQIVLAQHDMGAVGDGVRKRVRRSGRAGYGV